MHEAWELEIGAHPVDKLYGWVLMPHYQRPLGAIEMAVNDRDPSLEKTVHHGHLDPRDYVLQVVVMIPLHQDDLGAVRETVQDTSYILELLTEISAELMFYVSSDHQPVRVIQVDDPVQHLLDGSGLYAGYVNAIILKGAFITDMEIRDDHRSILWHP